MRRRWIVVTVLLATLGAGCSPADRGIASGGPALPGYSPSPAAEPSVSARPSAPVSEQVPLPTGFPVLPGAVAVELPIYDPDVIGLWESNQLGSAAYDYYVGALPQAGYRIVGLYPGGDVALIRFLGPGGAIWQLIAYGAPDGLVAIEVRLDRP
jgi:hypothetical protein